jgi:hypothetical protein
MTLPLVHSALQASVINRNYKDMTYYSKQHSWREIELCNGARRSAGKQTAMQLNVCVCFCVCSDRPPSEAHTHTHTHIHTHTYTQYLPYACLSTKNFNFLPLCILKTLHNVSFSPQKYTSWSTKRKSESSLHLQMGVISGFHRGVDEIFALFEMATN